MTTRTTFVPLHSIIVERDGKQVDAYVEYQKTGKAFKFTAEEIDQITEGHDGQVELALRSPTEEAAEDEVAPAPVASNEKPDKKAAAKDGDL